MQQAIQHVDHVVILVKRENLGTYADRLGKILGISFDEPIISPSGTLVTFCWDAGLEIIAPTREEGVYWDRLQRFGEGSVSIVFGVANLDEGIKRAAANGAPVFRGAKVNGDEPWLKRFSTFREAGLSAFSDELSCSFVLSEIVEAGTVGVVPPPARGETSCT
jgi:hypothetical protein